MHASESSANEAIEKFKFWWTIYPQSHKQNDNQN